MNNWGTKTSENWNEEKVRIDLRFLFLNSFEVEWGWGLKRAGLTFKLSFASPQTVNNGSDSDASQTMSIRLGLFTLDVTVDPEHQSILKINCKKHKIHCNSFRELPFSFTFSSWYSTLYLNLRSIASALRPNAHSYFSVKGQGSGQAEKESILAPNVSLMPHLNIYKDEQALTCLLDWSFSFCEKIKIFAFFFVFLTSIFQVRFLQKDYCKVNNGKRR